MAESIDARSLPHDLMAERAVLGAVLIDPNQFDAAAQIVQSAMFWLPEHGMVFSSFARLRAKGTPIDFQTVRADMTQHDTLEKFGGITALLALTDGVTRASNVEAYARIVRETAARRALIYAARQTIEDAIDGDDELAVLQDRAEARLSEIDRHTGSRGDYVLAEDWMLEVSREIERAIDAPREVSGVTTGLPTLDRMTRGLQPSELIYVAARPSAGKTSLLMQMALASSEEGMAGIVSAEMSRLALGVRAVSMMTRIEAHRLFTGFVAQREIAVITQALSELAGRRLAIDDAAGQTTQSIRAKARALAKRYGCRVLFIDYMQLLSDAARHENRNHDLAAVSKGLKSLAKELNMPVVALSQLSRDSAKQGKKPSVHDMRDSGALEQDADVVILLYRPEQHSEDASTRYQDGEPAELIVGKNRNGPVGTIPIQWHGATMRFVERSAAADAPQQGRLA